MSKLRLLDLTVLFLWWIADNIVVFGRRATSARQADRLSLLWIVLCSWVGVGLSISLGFAGAGALGAFTVPAQVAGLALLAAGIIIRSRAIAQLGPLHMPVVAIQSGHRLMDTGLYRHVRHPSYLGACIAYLGFGLGLGSYLSAAVVLGLVLMGYAYRIHVEEKVLLESLGGEYAAYQRRTSRLIPGIY